MLVGPLAVASAARVSPWRVAYVARVYFPPGDRRISRPQVYLSDLTGRRRRQLTFGRSDVGEVRWIDRWTLAWRTGGGGERRFRLADGAPTPIRLLPGLSPEVRRALDRPFASEDPTSRFPKRRTRVDGGRDAAESWVAVNWQGAVAGCDVRLRMTEPRLDRYELYLAKSGRVLVPPPYGATQPVNSLDGLADAKDAAKDVWVFFSDSMSTWGPYYELVRFDRRSGRVRMDTGPLHAIDFRPDRAEYAYVEPRNATDHGRLRVWAAPVTVGDWRKGTHWKLPIGTAWATSVQLRP